jgi:hypothetical protein
MNIDQYTNLIKAVTMFGFLMLSAIIVNRCAFNPTKKPENVALIPTNPYEKKIIFIDSAIVSIPFAYADSTRTKFFKDYTKNR